MAELHTSDNIVQHGYHAGSVRPEAPSFVEAIRKGVRRTGYALLATGIGTLVFSMAKTIYEVGAGNRSEDALLGVYALAITGLVAGGTAIVASREK